MAEKDEDKIALTEYTISKRPSIKTEDRFLLWVRSGGRCAICNKYLLDLTYSVNTGEMAHVVGWSKAKNSPRGEAEMPLDDRNNVDNLVLLCAEHHKIVDTKALLEEFTIERLIIHKIKHEQRIFHLTSLHADAESVVLRMLGGIRGVNVEVSKEHVRDVVFKSEQKFAMYLNSFDRHGIEIDLHTLGEPEDAWDAYWMMGKSIIDKSLQPLADGIQKGGIRHLSVFALSRIPLLAYLGYKLGDKIPTSLYQKQRGTTETWAWSGEGSEVQFEINCMNKHESDNLSLVLSISGSISLDDLPDASKSGSNVYEIRPIGVTPHRDVFTNRKSLENFTSVYHRFLSELERSHKGSRNIDLFPAIPVTAAIACGRGLMRDVQPSITIYDRTTNGYQSTLKINSNETN